MDPHVEQNCLGIEWIEDLAEDFLNLVAEYLDEYLELENWIFVP